MDPDGNEGRLRVVVEPSDSRLKDEAGKGVQVMRSLELAMTNCSARAPAGKGEVKAAWLLLVAAVGSIVGAVLRT